MTSRRNATIFAAILAAVPTADACSVYVDGTGGDFLLLIADVTGRRRATVYDELGPAHERTWRRSP